MFKMLIVEDERWEREGLVDFLDWHQMGIEIAAVACDGIEGMEMALRLQPDIIVTDIQMPGMNGIEMSKRIREQLPYVRIIVLTGYDDFDYTRGAIHFHADDYLLKPVEEAEMLSTMAKVVRRCEENQLLRLQEERQRTQAMKAERLSLDKLLADFLKGAQKPESLLPLLYGNHVIEPAAVYAVVAVAGLQDAGMDELSQELSTLGVAHSIAAAPDMAAALLLCDATGEGPAAGLAQPMQAAAGLLAQLKDASGFAPAIGVGRSCLAAEQLPESYIEAVNAVRFALFQGQTGLFACEEEQRVKREFAAHSGEFMSKWQELSRQLRFHLLAANSLQADETLEQLIQLLEMNPGAGQEAIAALVYHLLTEISLLGGQQETQAEDRREEIKQIYKKESLQEMLHYVREFLAGMKREMDSKRSNKDDFLVEKVMRLVESKYGYSELNLALIASEVFVSPNHLGLIFKKRTGKTVHEYLSEYRMSKAEELLRTTRQKVAAIAEKTGISSTSYFISLFKNKHGMTPGEYQEMMHQR